MILLTVAVAAFVVVAVQQIIKKPNVTILVALGFLFFIGVFAYSASAIISAIAITLGFMLSLALVFGGIRTNK